MWGELQLWRDPKTTLKNKGITQELLQDLNSSDAAGLVNDSLSVDKKNLKRIFLELVVDHGSLSKSPRVTFVWHFGFVVADTPA